MGIAIISDNERIAIDSHGVRFWGSRILSHEQAQAERACTDKKGVTDYHALTDHLLKRKIHGWEPYPDAITENGEPVQFSTEALVRLPLDVKNDLIGKLYASSPDHSGN